MPKNKSKHHKSLPLQKRRITKSKPKPKSLKKPPSQQPTIPFSPDDRILLIGEGDLSFARSLITHHGCKNINATVLETKEELTRKYPGVASNIESVEGGGGRVRYGVDGGNMGVWTDGEGKGKGKEKKGGMDRIIFNFPHVGGKSTDVNRQVRYNQELLVSFFKRAISSLAPSTKRSTSSIIVTLFEGEPYTLWNIRDLARHSGLEVERSFKFQAKAYPGYKHARTLGVFRGKDGEVGGGWRGEERPARSFVFVIKGEGPVQGAGKRQRKASGSDSEDESGEEDSEMMDHSEEEEEFEED